MTNDKPLNLSYLPLDMLNPHTCTATDLKAVASLPDCPRDVRAYIIGFLAGRTPPQVPLSH